MTDFTEGATNLLFSLWARTDGSSPENDAEDIPLLATALQAAYEKGKAEERERVLTIIEKSEGDMDFAKFQIRGAKP